MSKRSIPAIRGQRVCLRLLTEGDLPMTLAWRNQDHIRKWFLSSHIITPDEHRAWFAQYAERDDDFVFVIDEQVRLHKPVGQVSLYGIDWAHARAEFGRLLVGEADAVGMGLAREATTLLVDYAFARLGLTEIVLEVLRDNQVAIALYQACGFRPIDAADGRVRMRTQVAAHDA